MPLAPSPGGDVADGSPALTGRMSGLAPGTDAAQLVGGRRRSGPRSLPRPAASPPCSPATAPERTRQGSGRRWRRTWPARARGGRSPRPGPARPMRASESSRMSKRLVALEHGQVDDVGRIWRPHPRAGRRGRLRHRALATAPSRRPALGVTRHDRALGGAKGVVHLRPVEGGEAGTRQVVVREEAALKGGVRGQAAGGPGTGRSPPVEGGVEALLGSATLSPFPSARRAARSKGSHLHRPDGLVDDRVAVHRLVGVGHERSAVLAVEGDADDRR